MITCNSTKRDRLPACRPGGIEEALIAAPERMSQIDQTTPNQNRGSLSGQNPLSRARCATGSQKTQEENAFGASASQHWLLKRDAEHVRRFAGAVATALRFLGDEKRAKGGAPARLARSDWRQIVSPGYGSNIPAVASRLVASAERTKPPPSSKSPENAYAWRY